MSNDDSSMTQFLPSNALQASEEAETRTGCLTVIRGGGHDLGKNLVIEQEIVLGRGRGCDLVIGDFGASRRHCRIARRAEGSYILEDLGSTNGTSLNGARVKGPWVLSDGEKIFVGQTVIRFSLADEMDLKFTGEVKQLLGTDPLTGLESKRQFDDALDYTVTEARRVKDHISLLMMDLDGIKKINDTHGHLFGAFTIQQAGHIIARVVGGDGRCCRFGGDEFTVFLPKHDKEKASALAERIRTEVESAGLVKDSIPLEPTISIGVATLPEDGIDVLQLIASADKALYQAKAEGKNKVCLHLS